MGPRVKPYPKPANRVWFICAAVVLTAFTIGIAIVVPAEYESGVADIPVVAQA